MSDSWAPSQDLETLSEGVFYDELNEKELVELESLLRDDVACSWYRDLYLLQAELWLLARADRADAAAHERIHQESHLGYSSTAIQPCISDSPFPAASCSSSPILGFLTPPLPSIVGYFSSGWPAAYLIATVIVGIGLLIGSRTPAFYPQQIARRSTMPIRTVAEPKTELVGRVTGMVDCKWAGTAPGSPAVPLGRKFELASGLMEITYDTGTKVILQGPVSYEVESKNGGVLAIGKLTARVDRKAVESNPQSLIPNPPSLPTIHDPLFTIKTPTATVTDLGTEFGVEVSKEGITETHVFLGKVRLVGRTQGGAGLGRILSAGQAARLDQSAVVAEISANSGNRFLRQMPAAKTAASHELIDRIDYSDTWTANSPTRPGSNLPLVDPISLQVEDCHGNPPRSWDVPWPTLMTTWPNDARWPGFQVQGSRSGVMEVGGDCHCGFEYNLRDDFVVQFDAVQTADLINITIGESAHYTHDSPSLSVFVRAAGVPTVTPFFRVPGGPTPTPGVLAPEIGIYHPQKGEVNTGLRSGIARPHQWHNYAVRFNLPAKRLTVWVDRECRGTIDLAALKDASGRPALAGLSWTRRYVSIGGFSPPDDKRRVWFDNFRVGSPREVDTGIKQREATTSQTPEK